jgi:hypothetical protein
MTPRQATAAGLSYVGGGMDLSLLKDPLRITAHNGLDRE